MKYFQVKAKCGHVGKNNYIIKDFYVYAHNAKEAAKHVRNCSRVKHHHKDAIRAVIEIDYGSYLMGVEQMKQDKYFIVNNSTDQRCECEFADGEIIREEIDNLFRKQTHKKRILMELAFIKETTNLRSFIYE